MSSSRTKVELLVKQGEKLEHVAYAEVPPFAILPEVLIWGNRVFIPVEQPASAEMPQYRECFAYYTSPTSHIMG